MITRIGKYARQIDFGLQGDSVLCRGLRPMIHLQLSLRIQANAAVSRRKCQAPQRAQKLRLPGSAGRRTAPEEHAHAVSHSKSLRQRSQGSTLAEAARNNMALAGTKLNFKLS